MHDDLKNRFTTTALDPVRWVQAGKLLDAENKRIVENAHLVYNQHHILHVGTEPPPAELLGKTKKTPDVILPEYSILPGLIDGHAHLFLRGDELNNELRTLYQNQDAKVLLEIAKKRVQILGRLGVIALRDGGDKDNVGLQLSRLRSSPDQPPFAAYVFSPGAAIHRRGRYGSFFGAPVEDFSDIDSCVQSRVDAGADHIKIVPTGIINFAKGMVTAAPQFSVADIQQFKQAAQSRGKHLMAHASGDVGIGYAIEGGVDTIEHGFFITHDQLMQMRDRGISWVPTFSPVQEQLDHADVMGWDAKIVDHLKRILDNHAKSLNKALDMGVNILVGSDAGSCGVAHGTGLIYEMELLERAGMRTLDILCQVTHGNHLSLTNRQPIGLLKPQYLSRFILTEHNPFESIKNLHRNRYTIFDGNIEDIEIHSTDIL